MKRIEANDPIAMRELGMSRYYEGDCDSALKYLTKAAELGDAGAHYELSVLHREGRVVVRDKKKEWHHLEEAAIGGHPSARHNLAYHEHDNGNTTEQ